MTLAQLFDHINFAYRGTDDDAPAVNTPDWTLWLGTTNRKLGEYCQSEKWVSQFAISPIGTVSAGVQSYDLDDTIILPADKVIITTLDNHKVDYRLVKPQERDRYSHSAYISGIDPQVLTFVDTIVASSQIVGGTINVAGYYKPDDLAKPGDPVLVDDPYWLALAVASELAFNDITYVAKADDLVAKANNLWSQMVASNRAGTGDNPRRARTRVRRLGGLHS